MKDSVHRPIGALTSAAMHLLFRPKQLCWYPYIDFPAVASVFLNSSWSRHNRSHRDGAGSDLPVASDCHLACGMSKHLLSGGQVLRCESLQLSAASRNMEWARKFAWKKRQPRGDMSNYYEIMLGGGKVDRGMAFFPHKIRTWGYSMKRIHRQ